SKQPGPGRLKNSKPDDAGSRTRKWRAPGIHARIRRAQIIAIGTLASPPPLNFLDPCCGDHSSECLQLRAGCRRYSRLPVCATVAPIGNRLYRRLVVGGVARDGFSPAISLMKSWVGTEGVVLLW